LGIPKDVEETMFIIVPWIAENQQNEPVNYTFAIEQKSTAEFMGVVRIQTGHEKK